MFDFNIFYNGLFGSYEPEAYWEQYPVGQQLYKKNILDLLKKNIDKQDSAGLTNTLIIAYKDGIDKDYTDVLMYLLEETWHIEEENIVSLLEDAKDPKSIELLYKTAINVPDYDEMRALAKKCIWALWAINTPEAIEKIKLLEQSDDEIIKEAATLALSDKE